MERHAERLREAEPASAAGHPLALAEPTRRFAATERRCGLPQVDSPGDVRLCHPFQEIAHGLALAPRNEITNEMPTRHDVVRIRQFLGRRRLCRLPQVADGLVPVTVAKSQRAQRHVRGVNRRAVIRMIPELRRQLQCVFRVSPGLCSCELETASKIRVVPPGDVLHGPVCVLGQMGELFESLQFRQRGDVSVKRSWRYPPQRLPVFQLRSHAEERGVRQNSLWVHLQYSLEARLGPRRAARGTTRHPTAVSSISSVDSPSFPRTSVA